MFKLPIRTWVRNAAAVFSAQHGAVAQQAREAGCSRETVYVHARKVEQHLDAALNNDAAWAELHAENLRLQHEVNALRRDAELRVRFDKPSQLEFATTAFAMGVSLRQIEDLMETLLAESDRNAPDHSTIGRWIGEQVQRATEVLAVLDPQCAVLVRTLAIDEIFFGGDRHWSASNQQV